MKTRILLTILGVGLCSTVESVPPENSAVDWDTVDAGGGVSTGGALRLEGTIGQPDTGVMTGGGFELASGFWFANAPADCNQDGIVDLLDFAGLNNCALGPGQGLGAGCGCFDFNADGHVTLLDFARFQVFFDP